MFFDCYMLFISKTNLKKLNKIEQFNQCEKEIFEVGMMIHACTHGHAGLAVVPTLRITHSDVRSCVEGLVISLT